MGPYPLGEAATDEACEAWARDRCDRMAQFATGSAYVTSCPDDEVERITGTYGANVDRLRAAKAKYGSTNLFRLNHNIRPEDDAQAMKRTPETAAE